MRPNPRITATSAKPATETPTGLTHPKSLLYLGLDCYRGLLLIHLKTTPWHAFTLRQWEELGAVLQAVRGRQGVDFLPVSSEQIRGVVLVGTKKMFSVGNDESLWANSSEEMRHVWKEAQDQCISELRTLGEILPTVAALSGYTCGAAYDVAAATRFRVMGDNARLRPDPQGDFILPSTALEDGLVDRIVAPDMVLYEAQEWVFDQFNDNDE